MNIFFLLMLLISIFCFAVTLRDLLVFLDPQVLVEGVVLLVCLDREERKVSLVTPGLL